MLLSIMPVQRGHTLRKPSELLPARRRGVEAAAHAHRLAGQEGVQQARVRGRPQAPARIQHGLRSTVGAGVGVRVRVMGTAGCCQYRWRP